MSANSNAQRLVVVPDADDFSSESRASSATAEPAGCSFCFGTGMEVVAGKGARRCRCRARDVQAKLLEAARIPRRYIECSLSNYQPGSNNGSQLRAFNYTYRLVREYPSVDRGLLLMDSYPDVSTRRRLYRTSVPPGFGNKLLLNYPQIISSLKAGGD